MKGADHDERGAVSLVRHCLGHPSVRPASITFHKPTVSEASCQALCQPLPSACLCVLHQGTHYLPRHTSVAMCISLGLRVSLL